MFSGGVEKMKNLRCKLLNKVRDLILYRERKKAMNAAIDYCIEHGILEDTLKKNRRLILKSLLAEFYGE